MSKKPTKDEAPYKKIIATNRKARYDYAIEETFEAGIMLTGSEVKSLRNSNANLNDGFAEVKDEALWLHQMYIAPYGNANRWNHEERRPRKLLLHRREIDRLIGKVKAKGYTIIPLSLYFNARNYVKVEIALGKGKKNYDKRETEKKRDWQREKERLLKR